MSFTNTRSHEFVALSAPGRRKALRLYSVFYSLSTENIEFSTESTETRLSDLRALGESSVYSVVKTMVAKMGSSVPFVVYTVSWHKA